MKVIALLLLCGPVLGLAIPSVQAQNPQEKPFFCTFRHEAPQLAHPTLYMTGVFHYRTPAAEGPSRAWEEYIRETYRIPSNDFGGAQCKLLGPTQDRQQYTLTEVEKQARALRQEVIHVDWRYTPDQAAAPPAPPTTSASVASGQQGPPNVYHCASWGAPDVYFSDTFDVPRYPGPETMPMIKKAFRQFLQKKYSLPDDDKFWNNRSSGCSMNKPAEETNAREQKKNIIETGWKYAGPFPGGGGH